MPVRASLSQRIATALETIAAELRAARVRQEAQDAARAELQGETRRALAAMADRRAGRES